MVTHCSIPQTTIMVDKSGCTTRMPEHSPNETRLSACALYLRQTGTHEDKVPTNFWGYNVGLRLRYFSWSYCALVSQFRYDENSLPLSTLFFSEAVSYFLILVHNENFPSSPATACDVRTRLRPFLHRFCKAHLSRDTHTLFLKM